MPVAEAKPDTKPEPATDGVSKPEVKTDTPDDLTPQLVKRVHELYEQLGREEVKAVEALEQAAKNKIEKQE